MFSTAIDEVVIEKVFGADGLTLVSQSTFVNGVQTNEIDFSEDGETPETVTTFRPDGSVLELAVYTEEGTSVTQYLEDGVTPASIVNFAKDGVTALEASICDKKGNIISTIYFGAELALAS